MVFREGASRRRRDVRVNYTTAIAGADFAYVDHALTHGARDRRAGRSPGDVLRMLRMAAT
jgi:hypothetical protein